MDAGVEEPPSQALEGGCACGQLRYRLLDAPLFVHACHCTRCQRETGAPFAHHALIEHTAFEVLQGQPLFAVVPSDSGAVHRVAHCGLCHAVLWNEWGEGPPLLRYVRVGTLDAPERCPPQAHIFTRSAQAWLKLAGDAPVYKTWYDARRRWPAVSRARLAAARAALKP